MTIRLGINPIGWTNDDLPALDNDIPLETCLDEDPARADDFRVLCRERALLSERRLPRERKQERGEHQDGNESIHAFTFKREVLRFDHGALLRTRDSQLKASSSLQINERKRVVSHVRRDRGSQAARLAHQQAEDHSRACRPEGERDRVTAGKVAQPEQH